MVSVVLGRKFLGAFGGCSLRTQRWDLGPSPFSWQQVGPAYGIQPLGSAHTISTGIGGVTPCHLRDQRETLLIPVS